MNEVDIYDLYIYVYIYICMYLQMVNWWFGGVGGLDFWDPLMKGIVTSWYPDSNPKPPPPNHQFTSECINMSNII